MELDMLWTDDRYGYYGLIDLAMDCLFSQGDPEGLPDRFRVCQLTNFELDAKELIEDYRVGGEISLIDAIDDQICWFQDCMDEPFEYLEDDLEGLPQLQRIVDFFQAINAPLLWLYSGWEIDEDYQFFLFTGLLRKAAEAFSAANEGGFCYYEPIGDYVALDLDFWKYTKELMATD
jgi:hypothetical protein